VPDKAIQQLKSHRAALLAQDAVLDAAMRTKPPSGIPPPGAVPIKRIFEDILSEFPNLVSTFQYNFQPAPLKAQIADAVSRLDSKIQRLEQEALDEATASTLKVPVDIALSLLGQRITEGDRMQEYIGSALRDLGDDLLSWVDRTIVTLTRIFASTWNSEQFTIRVGLKAVENRPSSIEEDPIGALVAGLHFLRSLQEELFIAESMEDVAGKPVSKPVGNKVFIGHGRSLLWRELKDFIADTLKLDWDEYNREPSAGLYTPERITAMLQKAGFAFIVMTGEDEQPGGGLRARENVVHEAGLFQGRLGFRKAIILLEDGCQPFSNIHGLTVIPFPKGNIRATFEDVRQTLKREGITT
jgi:hypothetical protein